MIKEDLETDVCIYRKYSAKPINKIETPGCWDMHEIGVFRGDEQIGSYRRGYDTFFETFFPFIGVDGKEYALYSGNYTKTEVMSLPDCKKVCETAGSFCPTGLYVPVLVGIAPNENDPEPPHGTPHEIWSEWMHRNWTEKYASFGFVSGCQWGDDGSDKVEYLDLSRVPEGIITETAKFGYLELPAGVELKDAVEADWDRRAGLQITIATRKEFKL